MRTYLISAPLLLLAACVAPAPPPQPAPRAALPPPPPPAPVARDWRDRPLTPGSWAYRADAAGSSAMFGVPGAEAELILRCDLASRTINLSWRGAPLPGGNPATITTSHGLVNYRGGPAPGAAGRIGVSLPARDPFLDKIAFSRGRVVITKLVSAEQSEVLAVPTWPEPARAVEDCRK